MNGDSEDLPPMSRPQADNRCRVSANQGPSAGRHDQLPPTIYRWVHKRRRRSRTNVPDGEIPAATTVGRLTAADSSPAGLAPVRGSCPHAETADVRLQQANPGFDISGMP
jgi:hypothetical protein